MSKNEKTLKMSVDRARVLHKQGGDIAKWIEENFSKEELNPLPKTWEEMTRCLSIAETEWVTNENDPAFKALKKLKLLRDCYRQGWTPDWSDEGTEKYCLCIGGGGVSRLTYCLISHILSFQDKETRDLFLKNFRWLIEQAEELL